MIKKVEKELFNDKIIKNNIRFRRGVVFKTYLLNEDDFSYVNKEIFKMILDITNILTSNNLKSSFLRFHLEYQDINIPKLKFSIKLIHPTNNYLELLKNILPIYNVKTKDKDKVRKIGISCERLVIDKCFV